MGSKKGALPAAQRTVDLGSQDGLEGGDMFGPEQRVMFAGGLDIAVRRAREAIPVPELRVEPLLLRASQRISIEHGRRLYIPRRTVRLTEDHQRIGQGGPGLELGQI